MQTLSTVIGKRVHLIGIGGIGMSGLAQLLVACGLDVSGSDRAINQYENKRIFDALRAQNISLFEQDGSYANSGPIDAIIYSTAIEDDNADFLVAPNAKRLHRAEALSLALTHYNANKRIAVCGSAGKTTVSAWLGGTFTALGLEPSILCGGILNRFISNNNVGNFVKGKGDYFIFEADESDKSVTQFHVEYTTLLNVGTDHYSKEELLEVFAQVLQQTKMGAVIDYTVFKQMPENCYPHLKVATFSAQDNQADFYILKQNLNDHIFTHLIQTPNGEMMLTLPLCGEHNILNALSILAMSHLCGYSLEQTAKALQNFKGVWRRFDYAGKHPSGAKVYDDYAHNIEKITSVVSMARLLLKPKSKLIICFQPHGFGPLKFMREPMKEILPQWLKGNALYLLLPVYYAGGTSSFTPTSQEVAEELKNNYPNQKIFAPADRTEAEKIMTQYAQKDDVILVLGARDNSLSFWAKALALSPTH